jgi:hypothetical protein
MTCQPAVGLRGRGCAAERFYAASAKQLATEYTLRGDEGRRSLLRAAAMTSRNSVGIRLPRAAAMTSHGSTLVSKSTPVKTVM